MAVRSTGTAVQRRRGSTFEENIVSSGSGKEMSRSAGKRAGRHRDVEEQWEDLLELSLKWGKNVLPCREIKLTRSPHVMLLLDAFRYKDSGSTPSCSRTSGNDSRWTRLRT